MKLTPKPFSPFLMVTTLALSSLATGCMLDTGVGGSVQDKEQDLIGGSLAAPYHLRSTVMLGSGCTAAKVGPRHYLTAAHCVVDDNGELRSSYGTGAFLSIRHLIVANSSNDDYYPTYIQQTTVHPAWGNTFSATYNGSPPDIAVIQVTDEIPEIPQARVDVSDMPAATQVVKAGMGCESPDGQIGPRRYKTADGTVLPYSDILQVESGADAELAHASYLFTSGHGRDTQYGSLCPGDSGGPLYLPSNDDLRVVGVNAWYSYSGTNIPNVSWADWHTSTALRSRFAVGSWLHGLGVETVGGHEHEGDGVITFERWNDIAGYAVSAIPTGTPPDSVSTLDRFEIPANAGDNYGVRVRGKVTAPVSGNYKFFVSGDNESSLYLGTSASASSRQLIASHNGHTEPREFDKYASQESASIYLQAGRRYYIEALMKEANQEDHLAVAWLQPGQQYDQSIQIIPGHQLTPALGDSACSCERGCSTRKSVTSASTFSGRDDKCYFVPQGALSSVSASGSQVLDMNGLSVSGTLTSANFPPTRGGGYYLYRYSNDPFSEVVISN